MKSLSELQDFFYEEIYPNLDYLEAQRAQIFSFLKTFALALAIGVIVLLLILKDMHLGLNLNFAIVSMAIGLFILVYKFKVKPFTASFKDQIIEKLVLFVDPSLSYLKNSQISKFEYESSFLFPTNIDRYDGDDLVKGIINGVSIKFSDLHTQKKKKSSKGQTYYATIFKGIFFTAEFNKHFKSKTIVLPDKSERFLGSLSHIFQSMSTHGELIKLDNPEFEKEFVVYSSDQIDARYILSHSLMQNILELKKLVKDDISISFNGSKIYIAIHKSKESFEPSIYQKVTNFDEIKIYYQTISILADIVSILNLDLKIWSKK